MVPGSRSAAPLVVVLPNRMAYRSVFATDLGRRFSDCTRTVYVLTADSDNREQVEHNGGLHWRHLLDPADAPGRVFAGVGLNRVCRAISVRILRLLRADYSSLSYRFNELRGFYAHRFKKKMSPERVSREALAGNHVDPSLGRPWPHSRMFYRLIYRIYFGSWQCIDPSIEFFIRSVKPGHVVIWHAQNEHSKEYAIAAKRAKATLTAVIGSWDRPTTKGPFAPQFDRFIVYSSQMKKELERYHKVPVSKIINSGWPAFDGYAGTKRRRNQSLEQSIGLEPGRALIVYAANAERLGLHEPSVVEHIVSMLMDDRYRKPCFLLVRAHPQDVSWKERFSRFSQSGKVFVQPADMGQLHVLSAVLGSADVVVATQGSISLDAVAMDACVVNVAFDGALERPEAESVKRWYEMDHYRPVVESGGVIVVESFSELDHAINQCLDDAAYCAEGRARLRNTMMDPLDGGATTRLGDTLLAC